MNSFNNGYVDLKDGSFKQRNHNEHYITEYISRDYEPSTKKQQKKILKFIKKTYPNEDDLKCILLNLGSALSGKSNSDQTNLFLLGKGSSGKSTLMLLTLATIECYFKELQSDTFSHGNTKIDKILNTFTKTPHIRIIWVNEMKDTKIDETLFKSFCEGKLQTTKVYEDGTFNFPHYGKCFITANTMPNIKVDSGVSRRFVGYTHTSEFTHDKTKVNEENHIYEVNKNFVDDIIEMNLLNAWFDILCKYCKKWLNGKKPKYTLNFQETKSTVMDSNDIFQDFIDSELRITNNPNDKIGKDLMYQLFKTKYPKKYLTILQVINSLKEKKLTYDCQRRYEKVKGSFIGVCIADDRDDNPEEEIENNNTNKQDTIEQQLLKLKKDNELLKAENEKLKSQIQKQDSEGHVDIAPDLKSKRQMEKILKWDKPVAVVPESEGPKKVKIPKRKPTNQNLEESELPKDMTEFCENIFNF